MKSFYTVKTINLVVLSMITLGVFNMYYFYRNFIRSNEELSPKTIAISVLYPLFSLSLITEACLLAGNSRKYGLSTYIFCLLFVFTASLPSDLKYISLCSFIPMLFINDLFLKANKMQASNIF